MKDAYICYYTFILRQAVAFFIPKSIFLSKYHGCGVYTYKFLFTTAWRQSIGRKLSLDRRNPTQPCQFKKQSCCWKFLHGQPRIHASRHKFDRDSLFIAGYQKSFYLFSLDLMARELVLIQWDIQIGRLRTGPEVARILNRLH